MRLRGRGGGQKSLWVRGNQFAPWDWFGGKFASSHKVLPPQVRAFILLFYHHTCANHSLYILQISSCGIHIFLLCRLKINLVKELKNMHVFLGPLAWLRTIREIGKHESR
jgi:hypothetical protein